MTTLEAQRSRQVAEAARDKTWRGSSFLREVFLGRLRPDLLPESNFDMAAHPELNVFYNRLEEFLRANVDPAAIDGSGEYPAHVIRGSAELGAFGMKIPTDYGGLGFSHFEYVQVMKLLGSYDANITALLSAHQAIGVPHPVELFGSEALKRKYLPRCARGAISAFALTEMAVGSDPARLATTMRKAKTASTTSSTGESSGAPMARSLSCWSCSRATSKLAASNVWWLRRVGRGSQSSTAAVSWVCARWPTA